MWLCLTVARRLAVHRSCRRRYYCSGRWDCRHPQRDERHHRRWYVVAPRCSRSRVLPLWALACVVVAADPVSFLSNFTQEGTPTDLTAFATTGENILYQTHTLYLRVAFTRTCASCIKYACRSRTHVWLHSVR